MPSRTAYTFSINYGERVIDFPVSDQGIRVATEHDFVCNMSLFLKTKMELSGSMATCIALAVVARLGDSDLLFHNPYRMMAIFHWVNFCDLPLRPDEELALWFHCAGWSSNDDADEVKYAQSAAIMRGLLPGGLNLGNGVVCDAYGIINELYKHPTDSSLDGFADRVADLTRFHLGLEEHNAKAYEDLLFNEKCAAHDIESVKAQQKAFYRKILTTRKLYRNAEIYNMCEANALHNIGVFVHKV